MKDFDKQPPGLIPSVEDLKILGRGECRSFGVTVHCTEESLQVFRPELRFSAVD